MGYFGPIELSREGRKTGLIGWAGLVAFVVLYDLFAIRSRKIETLTRSFWRLSSRRSGLIFTHIAWLLTTLHLVVEFRARRAYHARRHG
jgi:hypothetical protein